ncbi:MAG: hypothetical protein HOP95_06320 [Sphingomonas sp.]|nr:hypothetical protein [Sphingomonas sp.]
MMHEDVIAHMRERIRQLRKVIALAHDPRIIEALEQVIETTERDIRTLEAEGREQG